MTTKKHCNCLFYYNNDDDFFSSSSSTFSLFFFFFASSFFFLTYVYHTSKLLSLRFFFLLFHNQILYIRSRLVRKQHWQGVTNSCFSLLATFSFSSFSTNTTTTKTRIQKKNIQIPKLHERINIYKHIYDTQFQHIKMEK